MFGANKKNFAKISKLFSKIGANKGHFFRYFFTKKMFFFCQKIGLEMCSFPVLFFGSKRSRFESFFRGFGAVLRRPQQGRLRHEVASKHRACQTP